MSGWSALRIKALLALLFLTTAPNAARAQEAADRWQYKAQLYLWVPGVDGKTTFPPSSGSPGGVGASVDLSDFFAFSNLQGLFMAGFEVRNGRWGAFTDFIYVDYDETKSGTRDFSLSTGLGGLIQIPADASADVNLRLRGREWSVAGTYAAIQSPQLEMHVLGGFRYLEIEPSVSWRLSGNLAALPPQSSSGSLTVKPDYLDAIVGVRGRVRVGQGNWFVPYHFDIGTGESDLTWQALAGIGYSIGSFEILGIYRHVAYNFASSSPVSDLSFSGPAVSVAYNW